MARVSHLQDWSLISNLIPNLIPNFLLNPQAWWCFLCPLSGNHSRYKDSAWLVVWVPIHLYWHPLKSSYHFKKDSVHSLSSWPSIQVFFPVGHNKLEKTLPNSETGRFSQSGPSLLSFPFYFWFPYHRFLFLFTTFGTAWWRSSQWKFCFSSSLGWRKRKKREATWA